VPTEDITVRPLSRKNSQIEGYLLDAHARQLSIRTIEDYQNGFRHFCEYVGDPPIADVTVDHVRHFLAHLGEKTVTLEGVAKRPERKLSKKSILNIHVALSALWTWASTEGFVEKHIIQAVSNSRFEMVVGDSPPRFTQ
jgi:site-specific recombinase XerD